MPTSVARWIRLVLACAALALAGCVVERCEWTVERDDLHEELTPDGPDLQAPDVGDSGAEHELQDDEPPEGEAQDLRLGATSARAVELDRHRRLARARE